MKTTFALTVIASVGAVASADVVINEVVGSTTGSDVEFVELYNTGAGSVDLTGWSIEFWDSDFGTSGFGSTDGASPYFLGGSIAAGGYWTIANGQAASQIGFVGDASFADNSIENGSYTMVLRDGSSNIISTIFVWDSGADDFANIGGSAVTADITVGPDGTFLPAGFYRAGDGSDNIVIHNFSDFTDYTPGARNVPAPAGLALAGLGLIASGRRRR